MVIFQFIVMLTQAFEHLAPIARRIHLVALISLVVATVLLICPAAIHRLAFAGRGDPRLHRIGSIIVTLAVVPLATSITCNKWAALFRLGGKPAIPTAAAALTGVDLAILCFVIPFAIRHAVPP